MTNDNEHFFTDHADADCVAEILADYPMIDILAAAARIRLAQLKKRTAITSPAETLDFLRDQLAGRTREIFGVIYLDTRHRVIQWREEFQGSIDGAAVYPRVIAERALRLNAAAVIVAHNHPSGIGEPSLADQAITRRIKDALQLIEVRLLDHFIVVGGDPDESVSFASRGLL